MKLNFLKGGTGKLSHFFRKQSRSTDGNTSREQKTAETLSSEALTAVLPATTKGNTSGNRSMYVRQVQSLLAQDRKIAGKPSCKRHPEIYTVCVDNFTGAFIYFLRMCDQRLLTYRNKTGHLYCEATFPDGSGKLFFTDQVRCSDRTVVARLRIEVENLQPSIREIRFQIKH